VCFRENIRELERERERERERQRETDRETQREKEIVGMIMPHIHTPLFTTTTLQPQGRGGVGGYKLMLKHLMKRG
jgi:hypothetical protein